MSKPLQTIIIGTSLTDSSDGVVQAGAALARATGAVPWLLHTYTPFVPMALPVGAGSDSLWIDPRLIQEQVEALRERALEQAGRTGLAAVAGYSPERVQVKAGSPQREIVELAHRLRCDLIVVGAAETSHGLLGSTAERVIRKASCPVLAVRDGAAFPPSRVELPVDLSPISAHALRQGLELLAQLGGPAPDMEALFVLNPLEVGGSIHFNQQQIERFAAEQLELFVAANAPASLGPPTTRVRNGYAREAILATLAERRADLVVLGTHGRSGFERLVLGSIASGVLREATCNLLVVPPAALRRQDPVVRPVAEPLIEAGTALPTS